jgi:hypothetical protein
MISFVKMYDGISRNHKQRQIACVLTALQSPFLSGSVAEYSTEVSPKPAESGEKKAPKSTKREPEIAPVASA